jgi:hypothetical protein
MFPELNWHLSVDIFLAELNSQVYFYKNHIQGDVMSYGTFSIQIIAKFYATKEEIQVRIRQS